MACFQSQYDKLTPALDKKDPDKQVHNFIKRLKLFLNLGWCCFSAHNTTDVCTNLRKTNKKITACCRNIITKEDILPEDQLINSLCILKRDKLVILVSFLNFDNINTTSLLQELDLSGNYCNSSLGLRLHIGYLSSISNLALMQLLYLNLFLF